MRLGDYMRLVDEEGNDVPTDDGLNFEVKCSWCGKYVERKNRCLIITCQECYGRKKSRGKSFCLYCHKYLAQSKTCRIYHPECSAYVRGLSKVDPLK